MAYGESNGVRDRWRHVTLKGQGRDSDIFGWRSRKPL